jgi:hypothetical protein
MIRASSQWGKAVDKRAISHFLDVQSGIVTVFIFNMAILCANILPSFPFSSEDFHVG